MADLVSLREFGRRIGVQLRAVQFAIETGRIVIAETRQAGKRTRVFIDWETQEKAWRDNTDQGKRNNISEAERNGTAPAPAKPAGKKEKPAAPAAPAAPLSGFQKHRSAREETNAKMAELNYKKEIGSLVEMNKVKELFFTLAHNTQQSLLNIPARVSAIIAAKTDEREIFNILEKEISQALETLSNAGFDKLKK